MVDTEFAFSGAIGQVLRAHFERDCRSAVLSHVFRAYYLMRPCLPAFLRQRLQRSRNAGLSCPSDWYIPVDFLSDLSEALAQDVNAHSTAGGVQMSGHSVIHPWPDECQLAVSLTHDIETQAGLRRALSIAKIEQELGIRSAWYLVPHCYPIDLGIINELRAMGHEIGIHGYNHDGRLFIAKKIFDSRIGPINEAGIRYQASGFRSPMVHRNMQWMQALEFDYDASCFDVDPFQAMPGGIGGVWPFMAGKLVELPYTLPQDHTLMVTLGVSAYDVWVKKLDLIKSLSGLGMLITHPDYLDSPQRQQEYQRFCEHVASLPHKWLALPREIASWWRQRQASTIQADGTLTGPASERGRVVSLPSLFGSFSE
ncbi:MAG: hypothetical protein JNL67_01340 [Planctomycetaceae bacterium]|nr:hypothetical protein [Planctomycetaceae bacterium]